MTATVWCFNVARIGATWWKTRTISFISALRRRLSPRNPLIRWLLLLGVSLANMLHVLHMIERGERHSAWADGYATLAGSGTDACALWGTKTSDPFTRRPVFSSLRRSRSRPFRPMPPSPRPHPPAVALAGLRLFSNTFFLVYTIPLILHIIVLLVRADSSTRPLPSSSPTSLFHAPCTDRTPVVAAIALTQRFSGAGCAMPCHAVTVEAQR